jgi:hypothetical protein
MGYGEGCSPFPFWLTRSAVLGLRQLGFRTGLTTGLTRHMASMMALKVSLGRIALSDRVGSGR